MPGVQILLTIEKAKKILEALQVMPVLENKELEASLEYLALEIQSGIEEAEDSE